MCWIGLNWNTCPAGRGESLPWWGCLCCALCFNLYTYSYVQKPTGRKFFVPAQSLRVVKLLRWLLCCLLGPHPLPLITPLPLMASLLCSCPPCLCPSLHLSCFLASASCYAIASPLISLFFGWLSCCCPLAPQPMQLVWPSLVLCFGGWLLCYQCNTIAVGRG